jgi:hypothetical protein
LGGGELSIGMGATTEINVTVAVGVAAMTVDVVGIAAEVTGKEVDLKELAVKLKTLLVSNETMAAQIKQMSVEMTAAQGSIQDNLSCSQFRGGKVRIREGKIRRCDCGHNRAGRQYLTAIDAYLP